MSAQINGLSLPDFYRSIGDDPFECSRFGCDMAALYFIAAQPCGPDCAHMHGYPVPMCQVHAVGHEIVGTTGD